MGFRKRADTSRIRNEYLKFPVFTKPRATRSSRLRERKNSRIAENVSLFEMSHQTRPTAVDRRVTDTLIGPTRAAISEITDITMTSLQG